MFLSVLCALKSVSVSGGVPVCVVVFYKIFNYLVVLVRFLYPCFEIF